jgi:hypothetical protein
VQLLLVRRHAHKLITQNDHRLHDACRPTLGCASVRNVP